MTLKFDESNSELATLVNARTMLELAKLTQRFGQTFAVWHKPDGTTKVKFYNKVACDLSVKTSSDVFAPGAAELMMEGFEAVGFAWSDDGTEWGFLNFSQYEYPLVRALLQRAVDDKSFLPLRPAAVGPEDADPAPPKG